jgi:hypothetical protein
MDSRETQNNLKFENLVLEKATHKSVSLFTNIVMGHSSPRSYMFRMCIRMAKYNFPLSPFLVDISHNHHSNGLECNDLAQSEKYIHKCPLVYNHWISTDYRFCKETLPTFYRKKLNICCLYLQLEHPWKVKQSKERKESISFYFLKECTAKTPYLTLCG